jgi:hypothetical protein
LLQYRQQQATRMLHWTVRFDREILHTPLTTVAKTLEAQLKKCNFWFLHSGQSGLAMWEFSSEPLCSWIKQAVKKNCIVNSPSSSHKFDT